MRISWHIFLLLDYPSPTLGGFYPNSGKVYPNSPNSMKVLSQRWESSIPTLAEFIPTLGGFITTLALGGFYPNSGRALSQLYPNSGGGFIPTLGGFLSQLWEGSIPTLARLYPNSIPTLGGFLSRVLSQLSEGSIPTLGRFYPNSIPTLGGFYHNSAEFFPTPGVFLKHRDAICGAQGRDFLSMGLLIFEHRDAIF